MGGSEVETLSAQREEFIESLMNEYLWSTYFEKYFQIDYNSRQIVPRMKPQDSSK